MTETPAAEQAETTPASTEGVATPAAAPQERPHIGCQGAKMSFDISVKVDTALLAKVINKDDADVLGVGDAHTHEHAMVAAFLNRVFEGSVVVLEAKPNVLINEGNGGFHIVTFVTDGYGNLVAEGQRGEELARCEWESAKEEGAPLDEFRRLAEQIVTTD